MATSRIATSAGAAASSTRKRGSVKSKRSSHASTKAAQMATDCNSNVIQLRLRESMFVPRRTLPPPVYMPDCGVRVRGGASSAANLARVGVLTLSLRTACDMTCSTTSQVRSICASVSVG